jgi:hypothetical protein
MLRSLRWSFSLRLGHGSGGLIFDHEGGAYQSVRWPSWWSASGPPSESCLAGVAEIGSGKWSSVYGAEPGALECDRGFRCRLEGGATKSAGSLAEGTQDRCASGTAAATGAEQEVCRSVRAGGSDCEVDGLGGAQPGVAVPQAGGGASRLSAHGGGTTCVWIG